MLVLHKTQCHKEQNQNTPGNTYVIHLMYKHLFINVFVETLGKLKIVLFFILTYLK